MPQVMTGDDIERALRRISHEILETHRGTDNVVLVGIHTRGAFLAEMLGENIDSFTGSAVPVGALEIAPFRDDHDIRPPKPARDTEIPEPLDDRSVVLVDDVLFTGRTVRAALDALSELGRARTTELAVLVDRGHREIPIRADYVGKNLPTSQQERVEVRLSEPDGRQGVWIEKASA